MADLIERPCLTPCSDAAGTCTPECPHLVGSGRGLRRPDAEYHEHVDSEGFIHRCYHRCTSLVKLAAIFVVTEAVSEFVTFYPFHRFFEYLGWLH